MLKISEYDLRKDAKSNGYRPEIIPVVEKASFALTALIFILIITQPCGKQACLRLGLTSLPGLRPES